MADPKLTGIVDPKSIAIIGASRDPGKLGNQCVRNILIGGYKGKVFPVNPKSKEILGLKCYPSVKDIKEEVDVALIFVPANKVMEVLNECASKQVNLVVLTTAGFSEIGNFEQEERIVKICKENNMRLIGPNVMGICSPLKDCNATFGASKLPYKGKIALVTQSGALALALSGWTHIDKVGLSALLTLGNMGDISFSDCIEFFMEHPETNCLTLYMEGVKDGRKFFEDAKKLSKKKPIVVLKPGESSRGREAISTHTGSLAGESEIYKAAFKQTGIIQVKTLEEMFNFSSALSLQPPMMGKNCVILTNGGGSGILATDTAENCGLIVQDLSEELKKELKKCVPSYGSLNNPIDLTGMATEIEYEGALRALIQHGEVDAIGILFTQTAIADPLKIAQAIAIVSRGSKKPIICNFLGSDLCRNAMDFLKEQGIPAYPSPEKCIRALGVLHECGENLQRKVEKFRKKEDVDRERVQKIVESSKAGRSKIVLEPEAERILKCYGIPILNEALAKSREEVLSIGKKLGFPVVMKIVSKDIVHKADAKCVKINVAEENAQDAYEELISNAKRYRESAKIEGVLVQQMAPQGKELIVGSFKDPQFGPCVMLGLGGIFVEALKDITFRVAPITTQEASEMIRELKSYPILKGLRGEPPIDFDIIVEILSRLSQLAYEFQEIKAIDANPIFAYEKGAAVADARVILE
jgi:acetyltransferase